jgi:prepilin-type N-terminal cleavage/methylation domain-containing protein
MKGRLNINNRKSKRNLASGYTLVEILVAVAIFFIIAAGPTSFFISSVRGQTRALASREIVDNSSYSLEYISRILRMAKKDLTGNCIPIGTNYENPGADISTIRILNYHDICQEFSLIENRLQVRKSTDATAANFEEFLPLTSDDLEVTSLKFQISGSGQDDDLQPRITILLELVKKGQTESKIIIQTTVSQRNLDVVY